MATVTVIITVSQDGKKYIDSMSFTVDDLRATPNPRQAMVAHFLFMARELMTNIRPHFTL